MPKSSDDNSALLDAMPALAWRCGIDGDCVFANAACVEFLGCALADLTREGWTPFIHPEDAQAAATTLAAHLGSRQPFTRSYRLRRHDGVYVRFLDRGAPAGDAGSAGFVIAGMEIEDAFMANASALDDFFEMSLDNVCVAGFDGYFKRLNQSWTRTLGWSAAELMSKPSIEFVHPEDRQATLMARDSLRDGSSLWHLHNRYLCKDGSHRWFEWRSVSHAERGLVYAIARDITQQKQAEESLKQAHIMEDSLRKQLVFADRMASVGTLAAGVAHEINNPLTYVTTNISLMLEELNGGRAATNRTPVNELRDMAEEARVGAERIRKIVLGLKTFSRAEEERRTVIEVQPLLDLSINMALNEIRQRARLVKDYAATPAVFADESRLGQVFINLLINAAQAIPEGDCEANEVRVVTRTDERGRVVIEVKDSGSGIDPQHFARIFDPFFTTKPTGLGTGLGLSICHNIVTGLGGQIQVDSVPGRGSTFRVVLPADEHPVPKTVAPTAPTSELQAAAQVLVVDDEPTIGASLTRVLRAHTVTAVTSGKAALALLQAGRTFDVVFCDLMMPQMSGMELFARLWDPLESTCRHASLSIL